MGLIWNIKGTDCGITVGSYTCVQRLRLEAIKCTIKYLESLLDDTVVSEKRTKRRKKSDHAEENNNNNEEEQATKSDKDATRKEQLEDAIKVLQTWFDESQPDLSENGVGIDLMKMLMKMTPIKYEKIPEKGADLPKCLHQPELVALWDFVQHSDSDGSHHAEIVEELAVLFSHFCPFIEHEETKKWVTGLKNFLELAVLQGKGIEYC